MAVVPSRDSLTIPWTPLMAVVLIGCAGGGDGETTPGPDPVEEACYHVEEGTIIDGGADADSAPSLTDGDYYRVVLQADAPTFVRIDSSGGTLALQSDLEDAFASLTTDGSTVDLPPSDINPNCTQDILSLVEVSVDGGEHVVELAESLYATAWVSLTTR